MESKNIFLETKETIVYEADTYLEAYECYRNDFSQPLVDEPILSNRSERYTIYPIEYSTVWAIYKKMQQDNWVVEEVDLSKDSAHWAALSSDEKVFLMYVLAFFASADGIVNANIKANVIDKIKIKEGECAYGKQFDMENVHAEMYALMIDTFIKDYVVKDKLINAVKTLEGVQRKAKWCERWIKSNKPFAHKIIAFAIVEAIFFSGAFASIFWLKTRGSIMPGLRKSNKFIARDEALHVLLACEIYRLLRNKLNESVVYQMLDEAIADEESFINDSLPCKLLGMNAQLMSQYIKYCADRLLVQLGYTKKYRVDNPFEFMKKIDTFCKDNFFESRNDSYSDAKINNPRHFVILENGF